ncbi:MAG: HAD-IC family P-type ATPase [Nanoarchaeota archaeon]|nr:HAD-IC family P-type ATPase [Nanoarchaeota archaeon]
MEYHSLKKEQVLKSLNTSPQGLTEKQARKRQETYGKNQIKDLYKINPLKIFLLQFKSFLIYILIAATILAIIISEYIDAIVIFAIIILNAIIGFTQQYKAEKSIIELRKILTPKVKVYREGKLKIISSKDIVPGDIIKLSAGDKIPADARIISTENLELNEAILTGESLPVSKSIQVLNKNTILAERKNMVYTGTSVTNGSGLAVVTNIGMKTEFGKIANLLQDIEMEQTPMQKKSDKFAKQITTIILVLVTFMIILGLYEGIELYDAVLMAIALAVSAIPEGLPAVITISLAYATKKMLKSKVIVRRLPAAETLGSVTVICTDKTGTLTEERMTVKQISLNNNFYQKSDSHLELNNKKIILTKELNQLLKISVLCNNSRFEQKLNHGDIYNQYDVIGDPTESALVFSALDLGVNKKILTEQEPRIKEISFDSKRKMMSIIRQNKRNLTMYTKGASSFILEKCSRELINGQIINLTDKRKKQLRKQSEIMENKALRVLAFAYKSLPKTTKTFTEENLIFTGFIGMLDPPRKEVKTAISLCKRAGIKVKMITGDSAITAKTIGQQIGITGKILTGKDLEKLNDVQLKSEILNIHIFARITPEQKLRIVQILKQNSEKVAITGDGVNDVLALKQADIGIAMGQRGSDVAREVSDMVLVDDNFASIVKAVDEGRLVYKNTKKITKYLLAMNFSEFFLIAFALIAKLPLPLLPLHILWMNLITDSIPALALVKEKETGLMNDKPVKDESLMSGIYSYIIISGVIILAVEITIFLYGLNSNWDITKIRTMIMTADIMFEMFFIYTVRSDKKFTEIGLFSNKFINYAVLLAIGLQFIVIYTPLNAVFSLSPLTFNDWLFILPFSLSGLVIFEGYKFIRRKNEKKTI